MQRRLLTLQAPIYTSPLFIYNYKDPSLDNMFRVILLEPRRDFRLKTSDFGLQTSDFRLRTSDFRLQNSEFRLQTSDFGFRTSDFRLQTSDFRLQAFDFGIVILSTRCVRYTPTLMDGSKCTFLGI